MVQMRQRLYVELGQKSEFTELFKPWAMKPVLAVFLMMLLYQFCGINPAIFNSVAIFDDAGWILDPLICNVIISADHVSS